MNNATQKLHKILKNDYKNEQKKIIQNGMILETAKQFVEQTGTNKNQAPYYQAILFIYIVLLISYEERYIYHRELWSKYA